jgi:hypothetical protein
MGTFAGASLLVSYYVTDSNSAIAQTVTQAATDPLPFTGLHRLEMRNAFALGIFRRILTRAQVHTAWSDVERDLRSRRLVPQPVIWGPVFRTAAQWAALHCTAIGCRSLDVLHVTLARKLNAKEFFTFDTRQRSLALALGMTVKP